MELGNLTSRWESASSFSAQQSTSGGRKDPQRVQILSRKQRHARRQRAQLRLQAARHILCRDLIYQTDEIVDIQSKLIVFDTNDTRRVRADPIEIIHSAGIAAQEHGIHAIHGDEVFCDV